MSKRIYESVTEAHEEYELLNCFRYKFYELLQEELKTNVDLTVEYSTNYYIIKYQSHMLVKIPINLFINNRDAWIYKEHIARFNNIKDLPMHIKDGYTIFFYNDYILLSNVISIVYKSKKFEDLFESNSLNFYIGPCSYFCSLIDAICNYTINIK